MTEPACLDDHKGEVYISFLSKFHKILKPKTYLEIGSQNGASLAVASCRSIAIDPSFQLNPSFLGNKSMCCLFQMPSDEFFLQYDPEEIFRGKIDFAFLDGMHLSEFLLRDFFNTEKHCRRNSVIALHDCIPLDSPMARRRVAGPDVVRSPTHPNWWTGDVWKTVAILKKHRPDIRMHAVDSQPTGLILMTNLDPDSPIMERHYFDMIEDMRSIKDEDLSTFIENLNIMPTDKLSTVEGAGQYFFL